MMWLYVLWWITGNLNRCASAKLIVDDLANEQV